MLNMWLIFNPCLIIYIVNYCCLNLTSLHIVNLFIFVDHSRRQVHVSDGTSASILTFQRPHFEANCFMCLISL